jgi:hypothetical protein
MLKVSGASHHRLKGAKARTVAAPAQKTDPKWSIAADNCAEKRLGGLAKLIPECWTPVH